jgi:uncharacterized protein (TIGR02231 family)
MKKAILLLFLPVFALAQTPKTVNLTSKIEHVTVFFNGAQIERSAKGPLSIGRSEIVFSGLTAQLDERSVQVSGDGDFTLLSVSQRTNYAASEAAKDTLDDLTKQHEILSERIKLEDNQLFVMQQEETILQRNQVQLIGVQNSPLRLDDLKQMIDFQRLRFNDLLNKRLEIEKDLKNLKEKLMAVDRQIGEQRIAKTLATKEIIALVETNSGASASFKISYIVPNSRWTPTYDLRVRNLTDPLSLQMKANVTQASGEDWNDVKLTLSTGNPTESGSKPTLKTWFLKRQESELNFRGSRSEGTNYYIDGTRVRNQLDSNRLFQEKIAGIEIQNKQSQKMKAPVPPPALEPNFTPQVAEKQQVTSTIFNIEQAYSIPKNGKANVVDIKSLTIPANYEHYVAPKLDADAFLTAKVSEWEQYSLLSGEANLFLEGIFTGKMFLNAKSTDDTLTISLGRDKNVVVTRTKLKDFTKTKFLSDRRSDSRAYEISVKNKRNTPLNILIEDQVPVSTDKAIEVEKDVNTAEIDALTGKIAWKLKVAASKEAKVKFNYTVKYPKDYRLNVE